MAKIRILFIGPLPLEMGGQRTGGVATHAWQLAKQAATNGYQVFFLNNEVPSGLHEGVEFVSLHPARLQHRVNLFNIVRIIKALLSVSPSLRAQLRQIYVRSRFAIRKRARDLDFLIREINPDIIHLHSLHNEYCISAGIAAKKIPIVITDHGFWQGLHGGDTQKKLSHLRHAADVASLIFCVSAFSRNQLDAFSLGSRPQKVIIPNPVDKPKQTLFKMDDVRKKYGVLSQHKVVLFIASNKAYEIKGLGLLLEAFQGEVFKKEYYLIIVCEKDSVDITVNFIRENNILGIVLPTQQFDVLEELYDLADCLVMPSKSESFGLVYAEALVRGLPIIGFNKIILELQNIVPAYVGEPFDTETEGVKELRIKIIDLLNKDLDRDLLGQASRECLVWDNSFKYYDSYYKSLLKSEGHHHFREGSN